LINRKFKRTAFILSFVKSAWSHLINLIHPCWISVFFFFQRKIIVLTPNFWKVLYISYFTAKHRCNFAHRVTGVHISTVLQLEHHPVAFIMYNVSSLLFLTQVLCVAAVFALMPDLWLIFLLWNIDLAELGYLKESGYCGTLIKWPVCLYL